MLCKAKTDTHLLATCIDHDHATNKLRGLLCPQCNQAIGLANDDPTILIAARGYLNHYQQAHHDEQLPRCTGRRPNMMFTSKDDRLWSSKISSAWRNYGYQFTREWFEARLTKQDGRCAICSNRIGLLKKHCVDGITIACVDHSHTEDGLRGLLCVSCNVMIGLFQENVDIIEASRLYLLSYQPAAQSGNLNAEGNPAWIVTEGKTVKKGAA